MLRKRLWNALLLFATFSHCCNAFQSTPELKSRSRGRGALMMSLKTAQFLTVERCSSRRISPKRKKVQRVSGTVKTRQHSKMGRTVQNDTGRPLIELKTPIKENKEPIKKMVKKKVSSLSYTSTIEALTVYNKEHGHLVMPRSYIVPDSKDYPSEWHGLDLASAVYDMDWWQRHVKQNPTRVAQLNTLGFVWERLQPEWNLVLEALIVFQSLHGHLLVPATFAVPYGSDVWPRATWGIQLGRCVCRMRTRHDFLRGPKAASRHAQLNNLGFCWDVSEHLFHKFYRALYHFAKLERQKSCGGRRGYRVLRVPSTFCVPHGDEHGWPTDLWGYALGEKCSEVRRKQLYVKNMPERQKVLEEIGFQWNGNAALGWLEVVHAAAIYSKMHNRVLDVPLSFVVPAPPHLSDDSKDVLGSDEAWPWPEQLWGFPLGQRLKDIRVKGAYLSGSNASARRSQLDALGFNWTPRRGRRKRVTY